MLHIQNLLLIIGECDFDTLLVMAISN